MYLLHFFVSVRVLLRNNFVFYGRYKFTDFLFYCFIFLLHQGDNLGPYVIINCGTVIVAFLFELKLFMMLLTRLENFCAGRYALRISAMANNWISEEIFPPRVKFM